MLLVLATSLCCYKYELVVFIVRITVCALCSLHRPQVTSEGPRGWDYLQQYARARAKQRQRHTRFDNMRHRYTQQDSRLNPSNLDHPQYPCPPGVESCDESRPSFIAGIVASKARNANAPDNQRPMDKALVYHPRRGLVSEHTRNDTTRENIPTPVNYQDMPSSLNVTANTTDRFNSRLNSSQITSTKDYRFSVRANGPSQGYRPRGSKDRTGEYRQVIESAHVVDTSLPQLLVSRTATKGD